MSVSDAAETTGELHPAYIYRETEVVRISGFKHTALHQKIKRGQFPAPIKLSDSGRATGWLGRELIAWQQARAAAREAADQASDPTLAYTRAAAAKGSAAAAKSREARGTNATEKPAPAAPAKPRRRSGARRRR